MLHRSFYEVLPYLYLATGIICALTVDSTLILIASLLLILAGAVVLMMRYRFRSENRRLRREVAQELHLAPENYAEMLRAQSRHRARSESDRRRRRVEQFPVRDSRGALVSFDRRRGERRQAFA